MEGGPPHHPLELWMASEKSDSVVNWGFEGPSQMLQRTLGVAFIP